MKELLFVAALIAIGIIVGVTQMGGNMTTVVMETSLGNIELELNEEKAPVTVKNFLSYVDDKHFDNTIFHRVIPGFMIQGGGFISDGSQKDNKAPINLESQNGLTNDLGTVAMARTSDPNSATSQFFINVGNNNMLNYAPGNDGYAVFGKVTSGMDVVKKIEGVNTATKGPHGDWPVEDVTILKVYRK